MNKVIKKIKNGDFEVVNTSYDVPVAYASHELLSNKKYRKYSVHRDNRYKGDGTLVQRKSD